jgi:hypothetical protein
MFSLHKLIRPSNDFAYHLIHRTGNLKVFQDKITRWNNVIPEDFKGRFLLVIRVATVFDNNVKVLRGCCNNFVKESLICLITLHKN